MQDIQRQKDNNTEEAKLCGAVLVVGAGISGIQAALDLSAGGFLVYLAEEQPAVGGRMTSLDKTFPTGDCATCIISPKLVSCMRDLNIEVFTMATLEKIRGEAGNFTATLKQKPRYIDIEKCTACGDCTEVCPVNIPSSFDLGLGTRKAIDKLYPQAAPNAVYISKNHRAPCSSSCPIDTSVQGYIALIAAGKFGEAAELIRRENPLPSICGRVCFHPCEDTCNRAEIDEAVSICNLKRFVMDKFPASAFKVDVKSTGKSVAIIGSGPSGLAAAHSLVHLGHKVVVYESLPVLGGMMAVGIPAYRLPQDILNRDINAINKLGVEFKINTTIGKDITIQELLKNNQVVYIASGAHQSNKLNIPGEDCPRVIHGIDFLRKYTLKEKFYMGSEVIVVGGGNTAIDAARTALRLGANNVTIIYRRTREEMPASTEEINATIAEGIKIQYLTAPVEVIKENNKMIGIKCIKMKLGDLDKSGRRKPIPILNSEFVIKADMLIPAVSQSPDKKLAELFNINTTKWGTITYDELTFATSSPGIFAGGDVVTGPGSVIQAISNGKNAAIAIDNYLFDRKLSQGLKKRVVPPNPLSSIELLHIKNNRKKENRIKQKHVKVKDRIKDFSEIEAAYTEEQAIKEASRCLSCAQCSECLMCVAACKANAVDHSQKEKTIDLNVGAVILTPGFTAFDPKYKYEYGVGYAKNIVTNTQFERILSASGPTAGKIIRPSDNAHPKSLAFIQCVGSRDSVVSNDYCSSVCCMVATKEAILAKEHEPDIEVTIFFMDLRAFGKDFERYYERAKKLGIKYIRCRPSSIEENIETKNLKIGYMDENNHYIKKEFEMAVFSIGLKPSESLIHKVKGVGIELNNWNFAFTNELEPLETSKSGIYVAGTFAEPKDIPDTVMQASGAAAKAMALLSSARHNLQRVKTYPLERDVRDEEPRVGVFVCHCGSNIASVVDIDDVVKYTRELPNVVFADHAVYVCADDSQNVIKEKILEHRLNRVVVASCTPRTHEPIFRDTLRDAGLNQYLLEMANIRDQCSWVHSGRPEMATQKAKDLVRMIVGRSVNSIALKDEPVPVTPSSLIIGGGIAGMVAAEALANQGFYVNLIEKQGILGGTALSIYNTLSGQDLPAYLKKLIKRVSNNSHIKIYLNSQVIKVDGHIGNFTSTIVDLDDNKTEIKHGVVILATGATEKKPDVYGYNKNGNIITQLELSEKLGKNQLIIPENGTIAMIQCVEQRDDDHPYCSRVCCTTAIKNALLLKEKYPGSNIVILYRDMRTYGFREIAYKQARDKGILFSRFTRDNPPVVKITDKLEISVHDMVTSYDMHLEPDLIVLSARVIPQADKEILSELLRVPLNADGFFLEAHVKLRPVDFASEGLFLCGTAHAPKFITETISQANAVAGRAAAILSASELQVSGQIAWVDQDKCISCMTCVHICPYNAPVINQNNKAEVESAVCMGCGSCTSDCPAKAITLRNYSDSQVIGAIKALLSLTSGKKKKVPVYPENSGITKIHWKKEI